MTSQAEQGSQKRSSTSTLKPRKRFSAPLPGPRSRFSLKRSKARLWLPMGHLPQLAPRLLSRAAGTMKSSRLLAIARMVIGESRNFPDLARMWHDDVVASVIGIVTGVIARAQARGEVAPGDPRLHAFSLVGPMVMAMLFRQVFGGVCPDPPGLQGARRPAGPHGAARPTAARGRRS